VSDKYIEMFKNMKSGDSFYHIGKGMSVIRKLTFVSIHKDNPNWIYTTTGGQLINKHGFYFTCENEAKECLQKIITALRKHKVETLTKDLELATKILNSPINIDDKVLDFSGEVTYSVLEMIKFMEE
jgi:hypothetical protein